MNPSLQSLVEDRYITPAPNVALLQNVPDLVLQQLQHKSVRQYTDAPVSDAHLHTLVMAAQSAATSSNLQVWSVVAVRDPAQKAQLAALAGGQAHVQACPLFLVWLADVRRLGDIAQNEGVEPVALGYTEMTLMAAIDASLAAQNAVLAAEAMGLGTVYIGGMRNQPEAVAEVLGLPTGCFAVFGMCVGWPTPEASAAPVRPRLPLTAVLHQGRYDAQPAKAALADYNQAMAQFQAQSGMPVQNWTEQSAKRVGSVKAMTGRERLHAALQAQGMGLS